MTTKNNNITATICRDIILSDDDIINDIISMDHKIKMTNVRHRSSDISPWRKYDMVSQYFRLSGDKYDDGSPIVEKCNIASGIWREVKPVWQGVRNARYGFAAPMLGGVNSMIPRAMVIWILTHQCNVPYGYVIDHIDRNPANDNPDNLQRISHQHNLIKDTKTYRSDDIILYAITGDGNRPLASTTIPAPCRNWLVGQIDNILIANAKRPDRDTLIRIHSAYSKALSKIGDAK